MHLVIINASPRVETKSNTARIIRAFVRGYEVSGNTTEVWHLSDRKQWAGAKMSFILQGGFGEASQLRCGEAYLEMLPSYFNCEYNGTLIKGDNFGLSWVPENMAEKMAAGRRLHKQQASFWFHVNYNCSCYYLFKHLKWNGRSDWFSRVWVIPKNTEKPKDARRKLLSLL